MLETWILSLWLVLPNGRVTTEVVNGFESRSECEQYGARYRSTGDRRSVEFSCRMAPVRPLPSRAQLQP